MNRIESLSKKQIEEDIKFYKDLGLSDKQAEFLTFNVFGIKYVEDNCIDKEDLLEGAGFKSLVQKRSIVGGQSVLRGMGMSMGASMWSPQAANFCTDEEMVKLDCLGVEESLAFTESGASISSLSNFDKMEREQSEIINEKGFRNVVNSPTSTFSSTVNTTSMGMIKDKLLTENIFKKSVNPSSVRIEEMLNYFDYSLSSPTYRVFNINTEICNKPNSKNKYLFVALKGKKVETPPQNIVFLVDASGSMFSRMRNVQKSIMTVITKLKSTDKVSLITYSSTDTVLLEGIEAKEIEKIIDGMSKGRVEGCTYASKGIEMAYKLSEKYFISDGSNRVIMMTDGDFNFGICEKTNLKEFISEKKKTGSFLTMLGFGMGNYQDDKMEVLAKNGNGNYFKISDDFDITEILGKRINSTLVPIAKDVKIQIEFNPSIVKSYRLLGYENRNLNHEDFKNDKVIAETVGSGHTVVAVYELEYIDNEEVTSSLKYQKIELIDSDNVCTVSVRYKLPDEDVGRELSVDVKNNVIEMSNNMKIVYAVILFAERLRKSEYSQKGDINKILNALEDLKGSKIDLLKELVKNCE